MEDGLLEEGGLIEGGGLIAIAYQRPRFVRICACLKSKSQIIGLAKLDHSQHINYWITFKENKIDIECFTHTME